MEAPEKVHIAIRSGDDEWGNLWVIGPKGTAAPPENATYVDYTRSDLCIMSGELVEDLYKVASTWLRHIDRQKERAETLARAASLARKGDTEGARRLKAQVDSAPRVYDGANMEPVMRKFKAWREGKNT